MSNILVDRLEKLKQAIIISNTESINYDNDLEFYDTLIYDTFNGNYDDNFLTNIKEEEKEKAFELAKKYKSLCFFEGDISYWTDSIEGSSSDYELVCMKLLDNYNFLLNLSEDGEESFKTLLKMQNTEAFEGKSILDYLRIIFVNDEVLRETIKKLNSDYKEFSDEQKAILCLYPEGVIYNVDDNENVEYIPSSELLSKIKINLLGSDSDNFHLGDSLKNMSNDVFEEIIGSISLNYQNGVSLYR